MKFNIPEKNCIISSFEHPNGKPRKRKTASFDSGWFLPERFTTQSISLRFEWKTVSKPLNYIALIMIIIVYHFNFITAKSSIFNCKIELEFITISIQKISRYLLNYMHQTIFPEKVSIIDNLHMINITYFANNFRCRVPEIPWAC